ncbi:MAG: site-specific integrase [Bacteroidetes bacterium]|nr:site-specific integrase [Bacteroidota bacterium]
MIKNKSMGILFYLRKDKPNKNGEVPIYVRITVDGKRSAASVNRYIAEERWNALAGKAKGTSDDIKKLNRHLDIVKKSILEHQGDMLERDKTITAETLKNAFLGIDSHKHTLLEVFEQHNAEMKQKEGSEFAKATVTRYDTTIEHIKDFLRVVYKVRDIRLSDLNYKFITDLEHYFKTKKEGQCNHNTTQKYIRNLRKIVNIAVANEWLDRDPFMKYKAKLEESKRTYLDAEELAAIETKHFSIKRLAEVRDIFVFCCYTGLAYVDVAALTKENIKLGIDGKKWIFTRRQKTDSVSDIPLLPKALAILEKYQSHPDCIYTGSLLPMRSNQKLNAYLKDVADLCDVKKDLTMHMARHTFSTTVTLANGMPMETLSKILGHKSMRTTQVYGKIVNTKVANDMTDLEKRLETKAV